MVGGESHFMRNDLRPFFEHAGAPILQPDPMRGGYYGAAQDRGRWPSPGASASRRTSSTRQMVHVLASIPNASYLEYMDWNDDLWIEPVLPAKDGTMSPPERPGHGLAFRPEILKDHRIGGSG